MPDPDRQAYLAEIADMMDDRKQRLGQDAAQTAPAWAVKALGSVPADTAARREWEHKAAFPAWRALGRDAILQPPKPQITPSARILQLAAEHDMELEATD